MHNTLHSNPPLNGILFNPIRGMSGLTNFFHQGWPAHKLLHALGLLDFTGMTFVAKTTTIDPREGNMPLKENLMPREIYPRCIHVDYWNKRVLNAVGLSGPGFKALFHNGAWQRHPEPFFISFMPVKESIVGMLEEATRFVRELLLEHDAHPFYAPFGVQINLSCPNKGDHTKIGSAEVKRILDAFQPLHDRGIAIEIKFAITTSIDILLEIEDHPALDGICVSNTIPFGSTDFDFPWKEWYPHGSPLVKREFKSLWSKYVLQHFWRGRLDPKFPGGLSGEPLRYYVLDYVKKLRDRGFDKPINAGGGILYPHHVDQLQRRGATSVSIGCVAILRPWRVQPIIQRAHEVFRASRH